MTDSSLFRRPLLVFIGGRSATARHVATQCSQIDLMPTVFGLLGWRYRTLGFGHDLLANPAAPLPDRAFVSNYQKIALLAGTRLAILKPTKPAAFYTCDLNSGAVQPMTGADCGELGADAIAYYQSASWLFKTGQLKRSAAQLPAAAADVVAHAPLRQK